jgi:hypothetical protein
MNIQRDLIISFLFSIALICCKQKLKQSITQIYKVMPVSNTYISDPDNGDIVINGQKYLVRWKVKYHKGILTSCIKFLPEAPIEYTIEELKNDTALTAHIEIPLIQNWKLSPNLTLITESKEIRLAKLDNFHYKELDGNRIFVIK